MTLAEKIAYARAQISEIIAQIKKTEAPEALDELVGELSHWWQQLTRLEELDGVVYGV